MEVLIPIVLCARPPLAARDPAAAAARPEHAKMVAELSVGDEIVTAGGLYGRIQRMDDDVLTVEIAPETTVRIARGAVEDVNDRPTRKNTQRRHPTAPDDS